MNRAEVSAAPAATPGTLADSPSAGQDQDWSARSSTPPRTPTQTIPKRTSTLGAPGVHSGQILNGARPVFPQVTPLMMLRARRDSNPQPSDVVGRIWTLVNAASRAPTHLPDRAAAATHVALFCRDECMAFRLGFRCWPRIGLFAARR